MDFPLSQDITRVEKNFMVVTEEMELGKLDVALSSALKAAGWKDGMWVKTAGTTYKQLEATDTTAVKNSFCVYTGSEKLSDPTTDTFATDALTIIVSKGWVGKTKEFTGTPSIGDFLCAKSGKLVAASDTAEKLAAVAVCIGPIVNGYLEFQAI